MSADAKPTPSEPGATSLAKSLEERLSLPDDKAQNGTTPTVSTSQKFNWADEVTTPLATASDSNLGSTTKEQGSVAAAQGDGATTWLNGSSGLDEPEFDVNVKLADLQEDPNNPLYSAKSFDELKL